MDKENKKLVSCKDPTLMSIMSDMAVASVRKNNQIAIYFNKIVR